MRMVVGAICLLSLLQSVTTGSRCVKEGKTRTAKDKCSSGQLRKVNKVLARAGGVAEGSWICLRHRNAILAEDKRCSCPSSWGHSKELSRTPIPERLYSVFDEVGRSSVDKYKPGTNWCNKCRSLADKKFASHPKFTPRKRKRMASENKVNNLTKCSLDFHCTFLSSQLITNQQMNKYTKIKFIC